MAGTHMAFMAQPTKDGRTGIYYIRRRIPEDAKPYLPAMGAFYKRSLQTKDPREAKVRFAAEWARSEELFLNARLQSSGTHTPTLQDAIQLAARWAKREQDAMDTRGDFTSPLVDVGDGEYETLAEFLDGHSAKAILASTSMSLRHREDLDELISQELLSEGLPLPLPESSFQANLRETFLGRQLELSALAYKRLRGDYATTLQLPSATPLSAHKAKRQDAPETLSRVFESWSRRTLDLGNGNRDVKKTVSEYQTTVQRFVELLGDIPITDIKRKTVDEFSGLLRRLPSQGKGIRKLNAHEQIARADQLDLPRLGNATIKNKLMGLSSVLAYAVQMELISENPVTASGITKVLSRASSKEARTAPRKGYTQAELIKIFSSPLFKGEWSPPRASFGEAWKWVPLLLCYTGARREEIAQMKANEVRLSEDGVWYLDLLGISEGSEDGRTLKTKGSHRMVALHPDLINLGFIKYAQGLPTSGPLFPRLKANPGGWYGHNFGKQWGLYLRKVAELDTPVSPSHGFRHAFKTMCREAGIPEEIHDAITGHDNGSVSRSYGERHLLKTQYEQLVRLPSTAVLAGLFSRQ